MKKKNCLTVLSLTILLAVSGCSSKKNDVSSSVSSSLPIADSSNSETISVPPVSSVEDSSDSSSEEEVVLASIKIETYPKTDFSVGDAISVEGGTLKLIYSDGNSQVIDLTSEMLSFPDDMTSGGNKTVLVSYEGKETSYTITLTEEVKTPTVVFSIENGASFAYDGTQEAPDISASVIEEGVTYNVFFENDGEYIGTAIPTEPGTYAIVIETTAGNGYESVRAYRWFVIEDTTTIKVVVNFSTDTAFDYDGNAHTPTILSFTDESGNPLSIDENTYTVNYTSDDTGYNSPEAPTEAAYYAMVVTFNADSGYEAKVDTANGIKNWCVFHIDAPTEDVKVVVNFSTDTEFTYDGSAHTPTILSFTDESGNELEIGEDKYTIRYEKDEAFYSNDAPTEAGTYAMVVSFAENSGYVAKVDTANGIKNWCVFTIREVTSETTAVRINFSETVAFEYDGQPHSPTIVSFTDAEGNEVALNEGDYTVLYSSDDTGYSSTEAPTEAAYYAMAVTFTDSKYQMISGEKNYVVFHIDAPTEDVKVVINFSTDTEFTYDGNAHTPTILSFTDENGTALDISEDQYAIHYEKDEAFYSNDAPTEAGTYAMVVSFAENSGYVAKVDTANGIKNWQIFSILEESGEAVAEDSDNRFGEFC